MTARHDKATTHGRDCRCTPCKAEDWDAVERGIADARATEGRTEAAAVDQAIADVRSSFVNALSHQAEGFYNARDEQKERFDAALRVLADAVEELRLSLYSRDILLSLANGRLEAAEAERDRLQVALDNGDRLLSQCGRENVRLARQVADLEAVIAAADRVREQCAHRTTSDGSRYTSVIGPSAWVAYDDHRAALAASSRDPQEPQT